MACYGCLASLKHHGNATGVEPCQCGADGPLYPIPPAPCSTQPDTQWPTSDILAHLIFEHQTGLRTVSPKHANYAALCRVGKGRISKRGCQSAGGKGGLCTSARYVMFADDSPLPQRGHHRRQCLQGRFPEEPQTSARWHRPSRILDLRTHLFAGHRCSYMLYPGSSPHCLPEFKKLVYARLSAAVGETNASRDFSYLPPAEKRAIRNIVGATLPKSW